VDTVTAQNECRGLQRDNRGSAREKRRAWQSLDPRLEERGQPVLAKNCCRNRGREDRVVHLKHRLARPIAPFRCCRDSGPSPAHGHNWHVAARCLGEQTLRILGHLPYTAPEFHRLEDKLKFLIGRFKPDFNFNIPCWSRLSDFKEMRDSLVHPKQAEDETQAEEYERRERAGMSGLVETANRLSLCVFWKPMRKRISELFIVDNSDQDWKVLPCVKDRCGLTQSTDIATGFCGIRSPFLISPWPASARSLAGHYGDAGNGAGCNAARVFG